jgi:hypothetical protein
MTAAEIKSAIDSGKKVCWHNPTYEVIKTKDEYLIRCRLNQHCVGLTWQDGVTLNGKEEDFYITTLIE